MDGEGADSEGLLWVGWNMASDGAARGGEGMRAAAPWWTAGLRSSRTQTRKGWWWGWVAVMFGDARAFFLVHGWDALGGRGVGVGGGFGWFTLEGCAGGCASICLRSAVGDPVPLPESELSCGADRAGDDGLRVHGRDWRGTGVRARGGGGVGVASAREDEGGRAGSPAPCCDRFCPAASGGPDVSGGDARRPGFGASGFDVSGRIGSAGAFGFAVGCLGGGRPGDGASKTV